MMGRTHALSGTLLFGGAALAYRHFGTLDVLVGLATATGAAMLPDLDHPHGTMARSLGPLSWVACHLLIRPVFGGHREGTHSLAFVALVGVGAQMAVNGRGSLPGDLALWLLLTLSWSSGVRLLHIRGWLDDVAPSIVLAALLWLTDMSFEITPFALVVGCVAHIAGDCLTDRGCPLLWPVSKGKIALKLFTTGKAGESIALFLIIIGLVAESGYAITTGVIS